MYYIKRPIVVLQKEVYCSTTKRPIAVLNR